MEVISPPLLFVFPSLIRTFETASRRYSRSEKKRKTSFSFAFRSLIRNFETASRRYSRSEKEIKINFYFAFRSLFRTFVPQNKYIR